MCFLLTKAIKAKKVYICNEIYKCNTKIEKIIIILIKKTTIEIAIEQN